MKTKTAILLLAGVGAWTVAVAQNAAGSDANVQTLYNQQTAATEAMAGTDEVVEVVKFTDVPLVEVIKTLAKEANINIIIDPKVEALGPDGKPQYGNVSVSLRNVRRSAVMEEVLNNYGLRLEKNLKTGISRVVIKDPAAAEPLASKIFELKYTNPSNLVAVIRPTLRPSSQAIADVRTSQLILLATEKEIAEVELLIAKLDTATRQVLIEARIIETYRNPKTDKGINWAGTFQAQNFVIGNNSFGTIDQSGIYKAGEESMNPPLTPNGTPGLIAAMTGSGRLFSPVGYLNADGAKAVLSFFNTDEESEIIAAPRAVTADNQPALLQVSRAVPIFKVTQGGTQVGNSVDITYTNLGTILEVTPRVSANSNIALKVVPEVSGIEGVDQQVFDGQLYTANIFKIRRISTQVLIPSGNTLVLGGLLGDEVSSSKTKVPILGDLPGLKYLFGSSSKKRSKSNLLIFVTPTLVEEGDYQPTPTDFLKTRMPALPSPDDAGSFDKPWDGVEPYDWGKAVY